jgi:hypothetical protein
LGQQFKNKSKEYKKMLGQDMRWREKEDYSLKSRELKRKRVGKNANAMRRSRGAGWLQKRMRGALAEAARARDIDREGVHMQPPLHVEEVQRE